MRESEDCMVIWNRKQFFQPGFNPLPAVNTLALWTMPVPAGIVFNLNFAAVIADIHMITESTGSAMLDVIHHEALLWRKVVAGLVFFPV